MVKDEKKNIEWNSQFEKLLEVWMQKAYGYRWIHDRCSKFYRKKHRLVSIPTLLLSTISSAVSFSTSDGSSLLGHFQSGITITATILIAMQNYLKFQSEFEKHLLLSYSFATYYREIQSTLVMPKAYRDDPIDIINNKRLEYDRLLNNQVHIPNAILKEYTDKFKGKIILIDIANGFDQKDSSKLSDNETQTISNEENGFKKNELTNSTYHF